VAPWLSVTVTVTLRTGFSPTSRPSIAAGSAVNRYAPLDVLTVSVPYAVTRLATFPIGVTPAIP
jgi:hypothetical protein